MSEKECRNGHIFPFSKWVCPECGGKPISFDGMNLKEYNALCCDSDYEEKKKSFRNKNILKKYRR
jgi:hypothetical protein